MMNSYLPQREGLEGPLWQQRKHLKVHSLGNYYYISLQIYAFDFYELHDFLNEFLHFFNEVSDFLDCLSLFRDK